MARITKHVDSAFRVTQYFIGRAYVQDALYGITIKRIGILYRQKINNDLIVIGEVLDLTDSIPREAVYPHLGCVVVISTGANDCYLPLSLFSQSS